MHDCEQETGEIIKQENWFELVYLRKGFKGHCYEKVVFKCAGGRGNFVKLYTYIEKLESTKYLKF